MAPRGSKLALVLLCIGAGMSAVQAQPSAQKINSNISLTLNSTTLLYSGQTVTVSCFMHSHNDTYNNIKPATRSAGFKPLGRSSRPCTT